MLIRHHLSEYIGVPRVPVALLYEQKDDELSYILKAAGVHIWRVQHFKEETAIHYDPGDKPFVDALLVALGLQ